MKPICATIEKTISRGAHALTAREVLEKLISSERRFAARFAVEKAALSPFHVTARFQLASFGTFLRPLFDCSRTEEEKRAGLGGPGREEEAS